MENLCRIRYKYSQVCQLLKIWCWQSVELPVSLWPVLSFALAVQAAVQPPICRRLCIQGQAVINSLTQTKSRMQFKSLAKIAKPLSPFSKQPADRKSTL